MWLLLLLLLRILLFFCLRLGLCKDVPHLIMSEHPVVPSRDSKSHGARQHHLLIVKSRNITKLIGPQILVNSGDPDESTAG